MPLLVLASFGLALSAFEPVSLLAIPPLQWIDGRVRQILVQPKENYYTFSVRSDDGTTIFVRLCDPYTGAPVPVNASSPDYDLLKEAYLRDLRIEVGVRNFGYDPQAGVQRNCVDRVSLYK
jgi:hypothetical protein